MKRVRIKNSLAEMCESLIESGENFTVSNSEISPPNCYSFINTMYKFLGKEIEINDANYFEAHYFAPYMYTEIEPQFRPFNDILEIPDNAVFRVKKEPVNMFKVTSQYTREEILYFNCGFHPNRTPKELLDICEMTVDKKTWGPAGVEVANG